MPACRPDSHQPDFPNCTGVSWCMPYAGQIVPGTDESDADEIPVSGLQIHAGVERSHRRDLDQHSHAGHIAARGHRRRRAVCRFHRATQIAARPRRGHAQLFRRLPRESRQGDAAVAHLRHLRRRNRLFVDRAADHPAAHSEIRVDDHLGRATISPPSARISPRRRCCGSSSASAAPQSPIRGSRCRSPRCSFRNSR